MPVAKTAIIMIFFFGGICSFQIGTIGRASIEKSDITLNVPVASYAAFSLKQWPVVINKFQIFSRGLHMMISKTVSTK